MPLKKWMDNIVGELLLEQVEQNSSLRSFIYCQDYESCSACRRTMSGKMRLEKEWRRDEVISFDLDDDDGDVDAIVARDDRTKVR